MMVETLLVEHFEAHRKGQKPSPTLTYRLNKYIFMLRMFATLTMGLCVGYGSSITKIDPYNFCTHIILIQYIDALDRETSRSISNNI